MPPFWPALFFLFQQARTSVVGATVAAAISVRGRGLHFGVNVRMGLFYILTRRRVIQVKWRMKWNLPFVLLFLPSFLLSFFPPSLLPPFLPSFLPLPTPSFLLSLLPPPSFLSFYYSHIYLSVQCSLLHKLFPIFFCGYNSRVDLMAVEK